MIPRPEYPLPQFERQNWVNLNGQWQFLIDNGDSGCEQDFQNTAPFDQEITVPFAPESDLSGIGHKDFMNAVWYQRTITVSEADLKQVLRLHFGAVDYEAHVYVNGVEVGTHRGGYSSFFLDIQDACTPGDNRLTVLARDPMRAQAYPHGKQSHVFYSQGCDYTRTTGIWQTVWLEKLPVAHLASVNYAPNIAAPAVTLQLKVTALGTVHAAIAYDGVACGEGDVAIAGTTGSVTIPLSEKHLWEIGHGRLYDVTLTFGEDEVHSYFGLREVAMNNGQFLLNGQPVFQKLVLDQGFYPDGIYTAPSDDALKNDIALSQACGFNGARLHQKAFEPRFLTHCDEAGYIVWGEMASWGLNVAKADAPLWFLPEWEEVMARDTAHPAIVTWCPLNETWDIDGHQQNNDVLALIYHTTKAIDPSRPVVDTSGNFHVITDIYDVHNYEQDPAKLKEKFDGSKQPNGHFWDEHDARQQYAGQPINVSEYGGIKWVPDADAQNRAWGYGEGPKDEADFVARFKGLGDVLLDDADVYGFCYTQLYDVEQERNGLYYYDRTPKFDVAQFKAALDRPSANETK
ncbi:glycoside hydrolase family 2 protein [Lacticaseibacillus mingshuiensis]|uniref:glycoside hydrolase family 2 protein n=1 Tax=Lacticaseibacillus mingshuiensis TaxID=2799574 RepID=UPI001CED226C|nr:sugar-binding domain-containing protein [Lacticaseibacillus mingshuiensis]